MGQNPGHIWFCAAIAIAARGDRAIFARLPSAREFSGEGRNQAYRG